MTLRLKSILTDRPELRRLVERTRQIQTLEQYYQKIAPPFIASSSHVLQLDRQNLVIAVDNGTVAAKLRQMTTEFISLFQGEGYEVTGIQVKVQVRYASVRRVSPKRTLSVNTQRQLNELAEKLGNSPLKLALSRLAHRKN